MMSEHGWKIIWWSLSHTQTAYLGLIGAVDKPPNWINVIQSVKLTELFAWAREEEIHFYKDSEAVYN